MAGQWVKLHRKAVDSQVFSDENAWRLFSLILMRANWRTGYVNGVPIPPGSWATSVERIAVFLKWSENRVRRTLSKLESFGVITRKATNRFTTITLCNWKTYQEGDSESGEQVEGPVEGLPAGQVEGQLEGPVEGNRRRIRKQEGKKERNPLPPVPGELDTPEFAKAWEDWQRHRSEKKKPLTAMSVEKQFAELVRWGPERSIVAIEHSIRKGWQGIFEPEPSGGGSRAGPQRMTPEEDFKQRYGKYANAPEDA